MRRVLLTGRGMWYVKGFGEERAGVSMQQSLYSQKTVNVVEGRLKN